MNVDARTVEGRKVAPIRRLPDGAIVSRRLVHESWQVVARDIPGGQPPTYATRADAERALGQGRKWRPMSDWVLRVRRIWRVKRRQVSA